MLILYCSVCIAAGKDGRIYIEPLVSFPQTLIEISVCPFLKILLKLLASQSSKKSNSSLLSEHIASLGKAYFYVVESEVILNGHPLPKRTHTYTI